MTDCKHKYCSVCGAKLIARERPANTVYVDYFDGIGIASAPFASKHNPETGNRQAVIEMVCPNKRWYNFHDKFVVEDSLHDILDTNDYE